MVSLQNGSADERQHVRGKVQQNQLDLITVIIANSLVWIQEGISQQFETSGDEESTIILLLSRIPKISVTANE